MVEHEFKQLSGDARVAHMRLKIAKIHLEFAAKAIRNHDVESLERNLSAASENTKAAWQLVVSKGNGNVAS